MCAQLTTTLRFVRRVATNIAAATPRLRSYVFPEQERAARFGRGDASYGLAVFCEHAARLPASFAPTRILEVGPGRNPFTGLLWAAAFGAEVVLWDVHRNMVLPRWRDAAQDLLEDAAMSSVPNAAWVKVGLERVAGGASVPRIDYVVGPQGRLGSLRPRFDYIYSHAALEHVWRIAALWRALSRLTVDDGLHTHRIDLADHGRRETNYLEMCEWSDTAWWLSQRFTPGALNRWRASDHRRAAAAAGFDVRSEDRDVRPTLPVPAGDLARRFRGKPEEDLRTTCVRFTLQKPAHGVRCAATSHPRHSTSTHRPADRP
jgi:SAM-dependent methyltransferase